MPLPTSLDNAGSSVDPAFPRSPAQGFAFEQYQQEKCLLNLVVSTYEPKVKRARRIIACGEHVMIMASRKSGEVRLGSTWCEHRTCPRCRVAYQVKLGKRVGQWVGYVQKNRWRFITLTMCHSTKPLAEQLDDIGKAFRKLRQTQVWKESQESGRGFFEVAMNKETGRWHPHLHIIGKGAYIDQKELSKAWEKATGGSPIVDVRIVKSGVKAGQYVSKYVGKPPDILDEPNAFGLFKEYYFAMRQRRMVITYGNAGPLPDLDEDTDSAEESEEWYTVGTLDQCIADAAAGDDQAKRILEALRTKRSARGSPRPG